MVKNLPCKAEDASLIPDPGTKIPHGAEQLSPHTGGSDFKFALKNEQIKIANKILKFI